MAGKMFTGMQKVLTLQFSAAMELTNDNGVGKVEPVSDDLLAKRWLDDHQAGKSRLAGAIERCAPQPEATLHFSDRAAFSHPSLSLSSLLYVQNFFFAALQVKAYSRI